MDGIHDMGGMHGFGRIPIEQDTVFDHAWQKRAFALAEALAWSIPFAGDEHRFAIEQIAPDNYLRCDYFDKWTLANQTLLLQAELVDEEELKTGRPNFQISSQDHSPVSVETLLRATRAGVELMHPDDASHPAFQPGQLVRVRDHAGKGHTRMPRYVRGRQGKIVKALGRFQFADAVAAKRGPDPQFCYTVEFAAKTIWGEETDNHDCLLLDLWEPYLDPC